MSPRMIATMTALLLCLGAVNEANARLVRDDPARPTSPAVEANGHHLPSGHKPSVPYSVVGAMSEQGHWLQDCLLWPWRWLGGRTERPRASPASQTIDRLRHEQAHQSLP